MRKKINSSSDEETELPKQLQSSEDEDDKRSKESSYNDADSDKKDSEYEYSEERNSSDAEMDRNRRKEKKDDEKASIQRALFDTDSQDTGDNETARSSSGRRATTIRELKDVSVDIFITLLGNYLVHFASLNFHV